MASVVPAPAWNWRSRVLIPRLGDLVERALQEFFLLNLWWIPGGRAPTGVQINLMEFQVFFANCHGGPSGRKSGGLGKFILERITVEHAVDESGARSQS